MARPLGATLIHAAVSHVAFLPASAPFGDAERAGLDAALRAATPTQRAWLAGFLAGLDANGQNVQPAAVPMPQPRAAVPLTLLFASESGN